MRISDFGLLVVIGVLVLGLVFQPIVGVYDGALEFSGREAYRLLVTIASKYRGRVVGSAADMEVAFWIAEKLKALGLEMRVDIFRAPSFNGSLVDAFNVYGVKQGSVDAYVVLVAHHDVVPWTVEGANDNGGGVAVLLELARVFAGRDTRLGIVFLSTDAEETGLHGARRFLETFKGRIVVAVSIDMCTWRGHVAVTPYAFYYPPYNFSDAGLLYLLAKSGGGGAARVVAADLAVLSARLLVTVGGTDSMPFAARGIPAVGLSDFPIYPYWHTPEDTVDKISPEALEEVGRLVERLVLSIDSYGLPRLGDQYLFVGDRVVWGPFVYAAWLAFLAPLVLAFVEARRGGGSLGGGVKVFLVYFAAYACLAVVSVQLVLAFKVFFPVLGMAMVVAAVVGVLLSSRVFSSVGAATYRLASLLPLAVLVLVGAFNPSTALVLLAPTMFAVLLARPVRGRLRPTVFKAVVVLAGFATPLAVFAVASYLLGFSYVDWMVAYAVGYRVGRMPLLAYLLFVSSALPSSAVALAARVVGPWRPGGV